MNGMTVFRWFLIVMLVGLMSGPSLVVAAGKRVAFVVGVGTYDHLPPHQQLKNAVNDATDVSSKLRQLGFTVMGKPNLSRFEFNAQWQDALDVLSAEDTFLLFFSGHGVQIDGQNYLLPRDIPYIRYGRQSQLTREAISVSGLLADLSMDARTHPKVTVMILDACRDNPLIPPGYKGPATPGGLASMEAPQGTFVMYSAENNATALDRLSASDEDKNSVYTRALLPLMDRADLTIQQLARQVKNEVYALTKGINSPSQLPTYYDGILGDFCLPGCKSTRVVAVPPYRAPRSLLKNSTGKDGAPMVLVPEGEFTMGSNKGDEDEKPAHQVTLKAFYIDTFEVTTKRYQVFMNDSGRGEPKYWSQTIPVSQAEKPVVGVTWNDAEAYCEYYGRRLPTEAEWEKAARGTDGRIYPWGNDAPTSRHANFDSDGTKTFNDFNNYGVLTAMGSRDRGAILLN
jgi:formylglycine-generating enzyme required for sulfatase activity